MKEYKLDLRSLYPDLAEESRYDYSILVDQVEAGAFTCECYGAQVTSRATGEQARAPDLTVSARRIDELMELLVRGQVGPIHLGDVVEDWL
jgi:hypothetical protein